MIIRQNVEELFSLLEGDKVQLPCIEIQRSEIIEIKDLDCRVIPWPCPSPPKHRMIQGNWKYTHYWNLLTPDNGSILHNVRMSLKHACDSTADPQRYTVKETQNIRPHVPDSTTAGHVPLHIICVWLHFSMYCPLGGFIDILEMENVLFHWLPTPHHLPAHETAHTSDSPWTPSWDFVPQMS